MLIQGCVENKMQCVLALLTLCAGAHSFSWDIVVGNTALEFYNNEGTLTYSMTPTSRRIQWVTYDPFNNRVLFIEEQLPGGYPEAMRRLRQVYSFDIATKKTQSLIRIKVPLSSITFAYDPATGLLFGISPYKIYSYLVKSGSKNEIDENLVIDSLTDVVHGLAVDNCGGYIYWNTYEGSDMIERARFNGSDREVIIDKSGMSIEGLTIDSQAQKIYWVEYKYPRIVEAYNVFIVSVDMNGKNKKTLYFEDSNASYPRQLTVSKDFIYWVDWLKPIFGQLPKNLQRDTDVKSKKIVIGNASASDTELGFNTIAAKYAMEEESLCA